MSEQHPGDSILHQDDVEEVIGDTMEENIEGDLADLSTHVHIPDAVAAVGSTPTKAEFDAVVTKLNGVLATLRDASLLPSS